MNKNIKFHLVSTIVNGISVLMLLKVHQFIIDSFIDDLFFLRNEPNFELIYFSSIFLFSWLAPFSIYKFKNYRKHFILFLFSLFFFLFSIIGYEIFNGFQNEIEYYNGLLDYCLKKSNYILFKEETLIASILISISIYVNQMIIGKKILPKLYIKNSGKSTKTKE